MVQQVIVACIVAAAALYAVWRWMPAPWRRQVARRLASGTQRAGWVDAARAERLAASLAKTSGCGACDTCGGCGKAGQGNAVRTTTAPAGPPGASPAASSATGAH